MFSASLILRLSLYPPTKTEIGSFKGAICSIIILSPGIQPISNNLIDSSSFSNDLIIPESPCFNSESFLNILKNCFSKGNRLNNLTNFESRN